MFNTVIFHSQPFKEKSTMKTVKKALVVLMLALSALPTFAQGIPTDPDGDGIPTGRDVCPLASGPSSNDGCPSGSYAARPLPTLPGNFDPVDSVVAADQDASIGIRLEMIYK
jgi:hypothetical protein